MARVGQPEHLGAVDVGVALVSDGWHNDPRSGIGVAHCVGFPGVAAGGTQVADAVFDGGWGQMFFAQCVGFADVSQGREWPALIERVHEGQGCGVAVAVLQLGDSLVDVASDSVFDGVIVLADAVGERVEPGRFLAVECVSLGLIPSARKDFLSADSLARNVAIEIKDKAAARFIAVHRHDVLYSVIADSSNTTRRPMR